MKFKDFYKKLDKETVEVFKDNPIIAEVQQKIVNAWMVHETIETNKKLIMVTWFLAISTIILAGISLFLK